MFNRTDCDRVMLKKVNKNEGFKAFKNAVDLFLETKDWNAVFMPKFKIDTVVGEMANRIIFWIYNKVYSFEYCDSSIALEQSLCKYLYMGIDIWRHYFKNVYIDNNMANCNTVKVWYDMIRKYHHDDDDDDGESSYIYSISSVIVKLVKDMLTEKPINIVRTSYSKKLVIDTNIKKPIGNINAFVVDSDIKDDDKEDKSQKHDVDEQVSVPVEQPVEDKPVEERPVQKVAEKRTMTLFFNGGEYVITANTANDVDITIDDGESSFTMRL